MFLFFIILLAIIVVLLAFFKYMGFFNPIIVKDITLTPSFLIYTRYQGRYQDLMETINAVKNDFTKFCTPNPNVPRLAPSITQLKTFGIYYDNPHLVINDKLCRAIIGGMVPIEESTTSESILQQILANLNKDGQKEYYFFKMTGPVTGFGSIFPLLNVLSIFYGIFRGYPAIKAYGENLKLLDKTKYSIEIYDRLKKELIIFFPYQGDLEQLELSGFEKPSYNECPKSNQ